MSKQMLGILLPQREWELARKGQGYEKVELYLIAAKKYNVDICFFCMSDINYQNGTSFAYFKNNNEWTSKRIPIPEVIHNRVKLSNFNKKKI